MITLGVSLIQILLTGLGTIVTVVLPERVPVEHRGTFSSCLGVAGPIGTYLGTTIAEYFLKSPICECLTFSIITVITTVALAMLCREAIPQEQDCDSASQAAPLAFFSSLAVIDFRWVFVSRFLIIAAYCLVSGYQLYLLQDYVDHAPGKTPLAISATLNTWVSITVTIAAMAAGTASDRLRRRNVFVFWAAIVISIATLLPLLVATTGGMLAYAIASGLGLGCYFAVDTALVADVLPDDKNGARDVGILNIAAAAPQILTPVFGAAVVNHLGGYTALLLGGSLLALLSAAAIRGVKSVR
jgi:MFS family permease